MTAEQALQEEEARQAASASDWQLRWDEATAAAEEGVAQTHEELRNLKRENAQVGFTQSEPESR